jgi:predicted MFS family arabinose efflux permease
VRIEGADDGMSRMSRREIGAALSLGAIFASRMLGLFMILPVFALYAEHLTDVTPFLAGLAIGAYGLTQALLQIPFGMLSDRFGRKPVIAAGLLIFAVGSVVAALSDSIYGVILGRALQGSGAIAAAVMALAADLTREEHRTKAMALIGTSIGLSFALALVLGPALDAWIGVRGIFGLTAGLAMGGIAVLVFWVPYTSTHGFQPDAEAAPTQLGSVLRDSNLLRLDFGIFALHMVLTATFVVLPLVLRDGVGMAPHSHSLIYLPLLVLSVLAMVPFILFAERRRKLKPVFLGAVAILGLAQLGLFRFQDSLVGLVAMLFLFFTAFNLLEATLPSWVSRVAPADRKGSAMGVYSSSQFLGAFVGGMLGGWVHGRLGTGATFLMGALLVGLWLLVAMGIEAPLLEQSSPQGRGCQ